MNHWGLFKRAWSILWSNRALWVFGVLPVLVSYALNYVFRSAGQIVSTDLPETTSTAVLGALGAIDWPPLLAISLVSSLIVLTTSAFADGALITMVNTIESGQAVSVGDGTQAGTRRLAPLLLLRVVLALPLFVLSLLSVATGVSTLFSTLAASADRSANILNGVSTIFLWSCLSLILSMIIGGITVGAERALVLENLSVWAALSYGWSLFRRKLGDFFAIAALVFLVSLPIGILIVCVIGPLALGGLGSAFTTNGGVPTAAQLSRFMYGPSGIIWLLFSLTLGMFISVLISGVYTLAYREWQASAPVATTASQ